MEVLGLKFRENLEDSAHGPLLAQKVPHPWPQFLFFLTLQSTDQSPIHSLSLLSSFSLLHTPGTLPLEASPWPPAMGACISAFICSFIHPDSFIQMCTEPPVCCCIVKLGPGDPETKAVQPRLGTLRLWGGRLQNSCSYTIQLILLFLLHSQLVSHGRTLPAPLGSRGIPPAASRSGGPLTITTLCSLCAKFSVLHMSRFL